MNDIISDLHYGNIQPNARSCKEDSQEARPVEVFSGSVFQCDCRVFPSITVRGPKRRLRAYGNIRRSGYALRESKET